jgi:hypothetical protein
VAVPRVRLRRRLRNSVISVAVVDGLRALRLEGEGAVTGVAVRRRYELWRTARSGSVEMRDLEGEEIRDGRLLERPTKRSALWRCVLVAESAGGSASGIFGDKEGKKYLWVDVTDGLVSVTRQGHRAS